MAGPGYIANDILTDVAYALVEPVVQTTLGTTILAGVRTVTPPSMKGIYPGAKLIVAPSNEVVTVSSITSTTFTATFALAHNSSDAVKGATFPSGQTTNPLFTQAEMLGYLADVQNEFLLRTLCLYDEDDAFSISTSERLYTAPTTAIRIERISVDGTTLFDTTQTDLDLENPNWMNAPATPVRSWYQDQSGAGKFGVAPIPAVGAVARLWFSKRGPETLGIKDTMTVPDIASYLLKYGVLSRAFSKEGEQRDPVRADYCSRRFTFGVNLFLVFMKGVQPGMRTGVPPAVAFNPFVVPQQQQGQQQSQQQGGQ